MINNLSQYVDKNQDLDKISVFSKNRKIFSIYPRYLISLISINILVHILVYGLVFYCEFIWMDRKLNFNKGPLWTTTFLNTYGSQINMSMASNNHNIPMDNLTQERNNDEDDLEHTYFDDIELYRNDDNGETKYYAEETDVHYSNRVHSIHRNRLYGSQNSNITQSVEARIGHIKNKSMEKNTSVGNMVRSIESHANLIVAKMEQDPVLMEDSPMSEQLRRETLRDMPQCLTLKRRVKVKLSKSVSQKSKKKPLSSTKMFKYHLSIAISRFKANMKDLTYTFELWYASIKQIEGNFGSGVASFFKFLRWIFVLNVLVAIISFGFIIVPQLTFGGKDMSDLGEFDWTTIFAGDGYLTNTFLYYGFYSDESIEGPILSYSMPDAYFFTMVCLYLTCFAILSISVASSYRRSFIETEGGLKNVYAHKIFCGWDYNIATSEAARLKSRAIFNELKELLYEDMRHSKKESCMMIFWTKVMQLMMNIFIIILMSITGYGVWFFMDKASQEHWPAVYTAIEVNVIMTLLPIIFSWVIKYEGYKSPKTVLYFTLVRTFVLGFVIIGVLVTFWLKNPDNECWETSLGQEIYRLIVFDFIFAVIFNPIVDVLWYYICRLNNKENLHFDIARNTMQVIYNQTLLWVGFFFSPFLPVIIVFKLFLMWYVRKLVVLKLCQPSSKSWRAAQATTWFLMMAFLSLLLVMGLLGYIVAYVPTTNCGPFSQYDYMYELVTLGVLKLKKNNDIWKILLYVTRPGFIALVLIALCGRVYYLRAKAQAQRGIVAIYREMLVWESRDKEFLLQNISLVTKGQWQYKLQDGRELDPITSVQGVQNLINSEGDVSVRRPSSQFLFMTPSSSSSGPTSSGSELDAGLYSRYKKLS